MDLWVSLKRIPLKYLSLVVLVFQNTGLVLLMRYSRTVSIDGPRYLTSTAVVLSEVLKFVVCCFMAFYNSNCDVWKTLELLKTEVFVGFELVKVSVPAILYTVQNNLNFVALSHLDAATFQVTYQLKILTTALFSVSLLDKRLARIQWVSLVILMAAVALVQLPTKMESAVHHSFSLSSSLIGLLAILVSCTTSGFSGAYTERILKGSSDIWLRNIQLSSLSFVISLLGVLVTEGKEVRANGFFQGYSLLVCVVIALMAFGGLIVSVVMKYADNILKGFATSISIVFSSLVSYFFINDFTPTGFFLIGACLVMVATILYANPKKSVAVIPIPPLQEPDSFKESSS